MFDIFLKVFDIFWVLFKLPLFFIAVFIGFFVGSFFFWYSIEYLKGRRVQRGSVKPVKKRSALVRIMYDAPRRYVDDLFNSEPDFFCPQGLIIFTGRQGDGKSSALMEYATELLDTYPEAKCLSNTKFAYQNEQLKHWKQLIDYKNGHKGIVVIMDELQNWFGSNQSRNFPPEMLSVITQNRKNRRVILGTAQNFYLLAKPIRSQCTEIRQCKTLAGVLTIVTRREPIVDESGDVKELKFRGMYFFVHTERLRNSYDTYSVIESLKQSGFHDNPMLKDNNANVDVVIKDK